MNRLLSFSRPLILLLFLIVKVAQAEEFNGIEFPQGKISFVDKVVSYDPDFSKGNVPTHEDFVDPEESLGVPDYPPGDYQKGSVSLGSGGRLTLKFTDNVLKGSNDNRHDIHIFEVGSDVEDTFVEISKDGVEWHSIGKVLGSTSSIDIDSFGFTSSDEFRFVRLTDDPNEGDTVSDAVGADIDTVGAISTVARSSGWVWSCIAFLLIAIGVWIVVRKGPRDTILSWIAICTLIIGVITLVQCEFLLIQSLGSIWFIFWILSFVAIGIYAIAQFRLDRSSRISKAPFVSILLVLLLALLILIFFLIPGIN
tara:strand:- start:2488 stop:3417 length:930 start_codon:yes stop_codon:yes gene_type:complete